MPMLNQTPPSTISYNILFLLLGVLLFIPFNFHYVSHAMALLDKDQIRLKALRNTQASMQYLLLQDNSQTYENTLTRMDAELRIIEHYHTDPAYAQAHDFITALSRYQTLWHTLKTTLMTDETSTQRKSLAQEGWTLSHHMIQHAEGMIVQQRTAFIQNLMLRMVIVLTMLIAIIIFVIFSARGKLKTFFIHDMLTSLYNRNYFMERLTQQIHYETRYHHDFALLFIDIDHFKHINQALGHQKGDRALKQIAKHIKKTLRESDLAFRFEGDAFVVLSPHTSLEEAGILAQRLCDSVAERDFYIARQVSISIGYACYASGEKAEAFIKRADWAMYRAKEKGRNRIEAAT